MKAAQGSQPVWWAAPGARPISHLNLWLSIFIAALMSGCIAVPVRVPLRVHAADLQTRPFDPKFLEQKTASRADVQREFSWMWIADDEPRLFCGHYQMSKWRVSGAAMSPVLGAEPYTSRIWGGRTAFIEFDDSGTVTRHVIASDDQLLPLIWEWSRRPENRLSLDEPITLAGLTHTHAFAGGGGGAGLRLTRDRFSFYDEGAHHDFSVAPAELVSIQHGGSNLNNPNDGRILCTLRFRHHTPAGDKLTLLMDAGSFFQLVRYLAVAAPNTRLLHTSSKASPGTRP